VGVIFQILWLCIKSPVKALKAIRFFYWIEFGKSQKALEYLSNQEAKKPLPDKWRAARGHLLLKADELEFAHKFFAELRQEMKEREDPEGKYLRRYSQYYLAMLTGNAAQAQHEAEEAHKLNYRPMSLLELPGPYVSPEEKKLEEEFADFLRKNEGRWTE
jgi:hypothetical protein